MYLEELMCCTYIGCQDALRYIIQVIRLEYWTW